MGSKLIILLVFASVAQSSYIPTLNVSYGLSNQQVAVLNKIIVNQEATYNAYTNEMTTIFGIFSDPEAKTDEDCSKIFEALSGVKGTIDLPYDSLLIVLGKPCSAVDVARNESYGYLRDAAVRVSAAFKLAQSGNYPKNRDGIESRRAKVQKDFANVLKRFYDSIPTCLNTTDANALAVIEYAYNGSLSSVVHTANAIFNAIVVRAAKSTCRCGDRRFTSDMKDFEDKALAAVRDHVSYGFSLIKTHYIYSHLNQSGIVQELFLNQYALSKSYREYKEGDYIAFSTIIKYLRRIYLGVSDDGQVLFSRDHVASKTVIAVYNSGDSVNLASILALYPDSATAISTAQKQIFGTNSAGAIAYFDAIHTAADKSANYSEVINKIATLKAAVAALAPIYSGPYLNIIRNDQTFDVETESQLRASLEKIIVNGTYASNTFLDAVVVLANATHTGKVSKDDFSAVNTLWEASDSGCAGYAQGISAASLSVLVANNVN